MSGPSFISQKAVQHWQLRVCVHSRDAQHHHCVQWLGARHVSSCAGMQTASNVSSHCSKQEGCIRCTAHGKSALTTLQAIASLLQDCAAQAAGILTAKQGRSASGVRAVYHWAKDWVKNDGDKPVDIAYDQLSLVLAEQVGSSHCIKCDDCVPAIKL